VPATPTDSPRPPARPAAVDFDRLTDAHLRAASAVVAVEACRPGDELPLLKGRPGPGAWVLRVVVGPGYRDEQVQYVRRRLAALRHAGVPGHGGGAARLI
jgi:hypothetical protein